MAPVLHGNCSPDALPLHHETTHVQHRTTILCKTEKPMAKLGNQGMLSSRSVPAEGLAVS